MAADLRVIAVLLPTPLRAPCPSIIYVTVRNDGSTPTTSGKFDVSINITDSVEKPFTTNFFTIVDREATLQPGAILKVPVRVQFPCLTSVWVRADVDTRRQIANNAHSFPPLAVQATPALVAWLATQLRVGLVDSVGTTTWDPGMFCPDSVLLMEVTVRNNGCAATPTTATEVALEDPSIGVLTSVQLTTPPIAPGGSWTSQWTTRTPGGGPTTLVARACADAKQMIVDQCDRNSLCAVVTKSMASGAPPSLTLTIGGQGFVRPGEVPALSWGLVNDCADLGMVTTRILFGTTPTEIFSSQQSVGLRTAVGANLDPSQITVDPSIANSFWRIGVHPLTLEITGTGLDPGPYSVTTNLEVRAEVPDFTWLLPGPLGIFTRAWKTPYTVTFLFFNRAFAALTLTGIDCVEHPTDQTGTASDVIRILDGGVTTLGPVPPMTASPPGTTFGTFTMAQSWPWTGPPFFYQFAPTSRTFDYTLRFGLLDAFGNVYPTMALELLSVTVAVSAAKLSDQALALGLCTAGTVLVVAGAACAILFPEWPAILACVAVAALGMGMVVTGYLMGYAATDPPVPDFDYHAPLAPGHRSWELPSSAGNPAIAALNALTQLLGRIDTASRTAARTRDQALAAHIDGDQTALQRLQRECRGALGLLRRVIDALPAVLAEVQPSLDVRLTDWEAAVPRAGELVAAARDFAQRLGMPDADFAIVTEVLSGATAADIAAGRDLIRNGGLLRLAGAFETWFAAVEAEYSTYDFLG
jgi:hypothetical protein